MGFIRRHAVGLLALIVALSGTAYAANKGGPQDIQPNAIRSYHIKNGQVSGSDLSPALARLILNSGPGGFNGSVGFQPLEGEPVWIRQCALPVWNRTGSWGILRSTARRSSRGDF